MDIQEEGVQGRRALHPVQQGGAVRQLGQDFAVGLPQQAAQAGAGQRFVVGEGDP